MEKDRFSNDAPEQVLLVPKPRRIEINSACPERAYGLFDTKTGTQVKDFVKGNDGQIEFDNLDPAMHYDVGVIENPGNDKPEFAIIWTLPMLDDTDEILSNSNDLPVEYPCVYTILDDKTDQGKRIFDLADDKKEVVAQAIQLTQGDEKAEFIALHTFLMVDNSKK